MQKTVNAREHLTNDPFITIWKLSCEANTRGSRYLRAVMDIRDHAFRDVLERKVKISNATSTKATTYRELNPDLAVHRMYSDRSVREFERIDATRLRLSSHNLAIETGRWARIPRDERLCRCGPSMQTEEHVVCFCPYTLEIRREHSTVDFEDLRAVFDHDRADTICHVLSKSLRTVVSL